LDQGIDESDTSKEDIMKIDQSQRNKDKCCQADSPCEGTRLSGATRRTVRCTSDCSPMAISRWHCGEKTTGLSGVKYGLSGVKSLSTITYDVGPTVRRTREGHQTVW
jgi:hypothetical protein